MIESKLHRLESAGFNYRDGGVVVLSGAAGQLFRGWIRYLSAFLEPFYTDRFDCPVLIDSDVLDRAGYMDNFPHQLVRGHSDPGHGDTRYLTPAACFHVYPRLTNRVLAEDVFSTLIMGRCSRHEAGAWHPPFRLSCFHMIELVVVGPRASVEAKREEIQKFTSRMFEDLGLPGEFEPASDAFFLGSSRGAKLIQQLKELKREYNATMHADRVVVASTNYHEDYFGKRFAIDEGGGRPASSCCTAFGIERLTALGLLVWGVSPADWPEVFRR